MPLDDEGSYPDVTLTWKKEGKKVQHHSRPHYQLTLEETGVESQGAIGARSFSLLSSSKLW